MIEIFNRLQKIFGRPITLVGINQDLLCVDINGRWYVIDATGDVREYGCREHTAYSRWIEGLLRGAKRNDAGELVQQ